LDIAEYMFNQDLCYINTHFNAEEVNSKRKLLLKSYLKFSCENDLLGLTRFLFKEINNKQEFFEHFHFDGSFLKNAGENKHFKVFKYLLEDDQAKVEAAEFLKDFPLHYVCENGSLEMVQYLIETKKIDIEVKDKEGRTPLHFACMSGSIEITKYLIEKQNANINTTDNKGRSVLHSACQSRCFELVKYFSQKTKQDVNAQDEDGSTVLHLACERRWPNLKIVKFLITDMKANLHLFDKEGRTPLHVACQLDFPKVSIAKFLVNQGANVLAKDKSGMSPLQIAKSTLKEIRFQPDKVELIRFLKTATKRYILKEQFDTINLFVFFQLYNTVEATHCDLVLHYHSVSVISLPL
jgi:ankyrin repeat protein